MERAKIIRVAASGEKGQAMAKAIEDGIATVDAQRDYADMLKRYDVLEHQKARLENEIEYLRQCLGIEQDSNRRFRQIYRNALAGEKERLFAPTRTEKIIAGVYLVAIGAIVILTVMLGYLIVRYCI